MEQSSDPSSCRCYLVEEPLKAGGALSEDIMAYGTHSCKATVLSWAAKYGLDAGTRARLGYHSRGAGGTELIYARDSMSQPLREMNAVLDEVRNGTFRPDATRSGYFTNPARAQPEVEQTLSSSSEGSEDEEDPEHEQYERAQDHIMETFLWQHRLGQALRPGVLQAPCIQSDTRCVGRERIEFQVRQRD